MCFYSLDRNLVQILLVILVAWGFPSALAQKSAISGEKPRVAAVQKAGPIQIDGRLNDSAWEAAPVATNFVQGEPTEGAEPAQPTEVYILYDDDAFYFGARMHDRGESRLRDQLVRRDQEGQYDYFQVALDPNLDRRTGYLFRVGAAGNELDAYLFDDTQRDTDFDAVWSSAVHQDSTGWNAELRIPFSEIRYESSDSSQNWGVNFERRRLVSNSIEYFALESRTVEGRVSQFGYLTDVELEESDSFLQVKPFVAPRLISPRNPSSPLTSNPEVDYQFGLDLSYGLTPSFTLDATFNPDFGQTEVDPEVVNLSAFETFFPEKRAFFVQEGQIFDFPLIGGGTPFFSRRIGRQDLQGQPPRGADFVDIPERNTIIGASKVTGRTQDGLSVGFLSAITAEETGRAHFSDQGKTELFVAQPMVETGVIRLQQDFRGGASNVGLLGTALHRELPEDGKLDHLTEYAYSFGTDFDHNWGGPNGREWGLSGYWSGTLIKGDQKAIVGVQTNSQHFFQRPDADYLSVDSTATSMFGQNWQFTIGRRSAENLTWNVFATQFSPDFAANDLGFNIRDERISLGGLVQYQDITPGPVFRNWSVTFNTFGDFRHSITDDLLSPSEWQHAYQSGTFALNINTEFLNNWRLQIGASGRPKALSDTETRGGPLMEDPASYSFNISGSSDPRESFAVGTSASFTNHGNEAGYVVRTGLNLTLRPSPQLEISVSPTYSQTRDAAQFVASTREVEFGPTFGRRHIFSDLIQKQVTADIRMNAAFTPNLSLQLFMQPLISANDFATYKQLARPESFDFLRFAEGKAVTGPEKTTCRGGQTCVESGRRFIDFDRRGPADFSFPSQDFNFSSLLGNVVLRWEYMSGSELFLVWRSDRTSRSRVPDFAPYEDLSALFSAPSEDTFTIKVRHFFNF